MVRLLSTATRLAPVAAVVVLCACGPAVHESAQTDPDPGSTTEPGTNGPGGSTTTSPDTTSGTTLEGSDSSSGGPGGIECPSPGSSSDWVWGSAAIPDYPGEDVPVDATCEALSIQEEPEVEDVFVLNLLCQVAGQTETYEAGLGFRGSAAYGNLDYLPGASNLQLSFFKIKPNEFGILGAPLGVVSLRDEVGDLILLSYSDAYPMPFSAGESTSVGRAPWIPDAGGVGSYEEWNLPFGDMSLTHIGCAPRESTTPDSDLEIPLVLEFESDDGFVQIYDRHEIQDLQMGGQAFDVVVGRAAMLVDPDCVSCPYATFSMLITRSHLAE